LVLPDGTAEDDALFRVLRGALDEPAAVADALRGNEDPLRVEAVDEIAEALALFADQRVHGYLEIVEEELRRRMVHHRADGTDGEAVADRLAHVDEQHRQSVGPLLHV